MTYKLFLLSIFLIPLSVQANIYYVNSSATGANNGNSWMDAFYTLQDAINTATNGDTIWVATGVYYPTQDTTGNIFPIDNRNKTFFIAKNIKLFGGFIGTETQVSQRDVMMNPTTLSGDFGIPNTVIDNAYSVVRIHATTSNGIITNDMEIDGFTIRDGYHVALSTAAIGAGINLVGTRCTPTIKNNYFINNQARRGGAIYGSCVSNGVNTNLIIDHNKFQQNKGSQGGGAIYLESRDMNLIISNNYFENNEAFTGAGGAIYLETAGTPQAHLSLTNNRFVRNYSEVGGGIYLKNINGEDCFPLMTHNSFYRDTASYYGGAIGFDVGGGDTLTATLSHNFFMENKSKSRGGAIHNDARAGKLSTVSQNDTFIACTSVDGGAIYNNSRLLGIFSISYEGIFCENNVAERGGVLYNLNNSYNNYPNSISFQKSVFKNNRAAKSGVIWGGKNNLLLSGNLFEDNQANEVAVFSSGASTFTPANNHDAQIYHNTFHGNTSDSLGMALLRDCPTAKIHNNLCTKNSGLNDAGAFVFDATTAYLNNNTFYANQALNGADVIRGYNGGHLSLFNNIIWGSALPITMGGGASAIVNYCIYGEGSLDGIVNFPLGVTGNFNIEMNPLFADSLNNDFRLQSASVAVDAGYNPEWVNTGLSTDIIGTIRPQNTVDIGAYESFTMGFSQVPVDTTICSGSSGTMFVSSNHTAFYQWQVNTGSLWTDLTNGSHYNGTTDSLLHFINLDASYNGNQYRCIISNSNALVSTDTSTIGVVTIQNNPVFYLLPNDTSICANESLVLSATYTATNNVNYQWLLAGTAVGNQSTLVPTSSGRYNLQITDSLGCTDTADIATNIKINDLPNVLITPLNSIICIGDDVTLATLNADTGNSYQWYRNGLSINGAIDSTYTTSDSGRYNVLVTTSDHCQDTAAIAAQVSVSSCTKVNYLLEEPPIALFPNPIRNLATIELYGMEVNNSIVVTVIDVYGREWEQIRPMNHSRHEVNLSHLPNGLYFLRVVVGSKIYLQSFNRIE
ncbi:T9SS type A sorting domain-containing protein [Aureispira anguillae]|uniref:T9SS type A sorting domain-containing protein n=1 Tax=Aureispira anguillae TaxID=2864201 RepID=A0A915YL76_9BACT|nr:T9SS type A sorting domain-containing protein [Aureispira anguillae]BDS15269.1 T9SS type A sorting domain-containing protein [Aureispira anguillae]